MSTSFGFEDDPIKQRQSKNEGHKKLKAYSDGLEEIELPKNEKTQEGEDELKSENKSKTLKSNMEHVDKVNVKQAKDSKQKQGTSRKDDCKSPSGNKFGIKGNSPKDNALKTNSELPNGIVNLKSDVNNEEELNECCKRKRKRYEIEQKVSGLTCIGILPGLGGTIESSDDSDQSCSSGSEGNERVKYDLLGRSIVNETEYPTESG